MKTPDPDQLQQMREDWDRRAHLDAERHVYTRDSAADVPDFYESGRANYDQLVRPFLPVLLEGRSPSQCRAVEIGCGLGRMTRWLACQFGQVDALDVSPEMVRQARLRLADLPNVRFHECSGRDLSPLPDEACDLVFSYIVFQHIPSRAVIENYVREAARVLRPRGVFKFQVNGDQSPEYANHVPDTWHGKTFSVAEVREMLDRAGLSLLAAEGAGTQYFVLTARKAHDDPTAGPRPYLFPGQPWAAGQLLEGWGDAVEESWRPVEARSRCRLALPPERPLRFFLGLYLWPEEPFPPREVCVGVDGLATVSARLDGPGDHYVEFPLSPPGESPEVEVAVSVLPSGRPPAVRVLGFYRPA